MQPGFQPAIVMFLFYNGSEAEGRQNFKAFFDLSEYFVGVVSIRPINEPFQTLWLISQKSSLTRF